MTDEPKPAPEGGADGSEHRFTSLDDAFDASMRELVAPPALAEAASPGEGASAEELLAYLVQTFAVGAPLETAPGPPARTRGLGGWLRGLARRLFVARTYHSALGGTLATVIARQAETERRLREVVERQQRVNQVSADVVFRLWGDYNYVVREIMPHLRSNLDELAANLDDLAAGVRDREGDVTSRLERTDEALRAVEAELNRISGPHDDLVRSVAELLGGLVRDDAIVRRLERLEEAGPS